MEVRQYRYGRGQIMFCEDTLIGTTSCVQKCFSSWTCQVISCLGWVLLSGLEFEIDCRHLHRYTYLCRSCYSVRNRRQKILNFWSLPTIAHNIGASLLRHAVESCSLLEVLLAANALCIAETSFSQCIYVTPMASDFEAAQR